MNITVDDQINLLKCLTAGYNQKVICDRDYVLLSKKVCLIGSSNYYDATAFGEKVPDSEKAV